MAVLTAHYGLIKPSPDDFYDIEVTNENTERIDQALYNLEQTKETPAGAQAKADQAKADAEAASIPLTAKGQVNGVASLDGTGKVPTAQLPAMNYDPAGSAAAVDTKLTTHIADKANPHNVLPVQVGGIPIVTTYTPEGGTDGTNYAVDIPGLSELFKGLMITIQPHYVCTTTAPMLIINDLEPIEIRRPVSSRSSYTLQGDIGWLIPNFPVTLEYNGTYWMAISMTASAAEDLIGAVPILHGGTGAITAEQALKNLGAVPTSRTVNGKALSSDISLTAADVGSLPKTGGAFTGQVSGVSPTGTTGAFRNIHVLSNQEPPASLGSNGDICIVI